MSKELLLKLQSTADGIFFIDNKGFLLGTYKKLWDLYPFAETISAFNEALKLGKSHFEIEEKERFYRVKILKLEENIFLVQVKDISCEKKLEKIKKDIVSTLSHELRTPITVIKGNAEYLLYYSDNSEKEIIEEILKKASQMLEILTGLNKLIAIEKSFREYNLKDLIINSLKDLVEKAEKKGLKVEIDLQDIVVPCEKILVEQMIRNLVDNAIKFTKKGKIEITLKRNNKEVVILIKDTGKGIKEELKKHIFEKYVKSPESNGQGIGLSIVKEIINYHNWKIDFQSEEEKGTTFSIKIPLS